MSDSKEEFIIKVLNKFRAPEGFGGEPMYTGLSIPEAITRWMAFEFGIYLNELLGRNGWYPVSIQCGFVDSDRETPAFEWWHATMRVNDGGTVHFSLERRLTVQDTMDSIYRLEIGRGHRGNLAKRSVWGQVSSPSADNERIGIKTGPQYRIDYNEAGFPCRRRNRELVCQ
jgi:hypothetical protein